MTTSLPIHVIGAGLAGSETAWQLAQNNIPVTLYEMRPIRFTPAHTTSHCAELVCSNSLRSDDPLHNAVGLLHAEMRMLNSLVMAAADANRVPAGSALAVDRERFSQWITQRLEAHPLITLVRQEVLHPFEEGITVIATGPLTEGALAEWMQTTLGQERLAFFDAIAPIVSFDSIDFSKAWKQSRWDKGDGDDYINCPLDKTQYETFVTELLAARKMAFADFEKTPYFEGCLPIEVMAERGMETLRYGPMKPIGLQNPHHPETKPWAVVQLRQDNQMGTLWNMVGFQTKLLQSEQKRIFSMIPGLESAEFMRFGALHRNTFLASPLLLDSFLRLKSKPNILFAGQITGVEGYVESAAMGLWAGLFLVYGLGSSDRQPLVPPPSTTALGSLLRHITGEAVAKHFQPMNVNFGLFPPLPVGIKKNERKTAMAQRAMQDLKTWFEGR
ncbi:MAG: methylenetetrahydrofolate--tRNA-(uracil(54)-C(5))-methyltransferase (FADH(2)-oxidizing) TrmFO [Magnetococcus sp. DMHC-6]